MKIKDYEKADCTLFRMPIVDYSEFSASIDKLIMEVWQKGYNPSDALNSLVNNQSIIEKIAGQISESVAFQKKVMVHGIEEEKKRELEESEKKYKQKIAEIEQTILKQAGEREKELQEREKYLQQQKQAYDATTSNLEEMRKRIESQISTIGGERGIEALVKINEGIIDPSKKLEKKVEPANASINEEAEVKAEPYSAPKQESPAKPITLEIKEYNDNKPNYSAKSSKGIFKRIWEILNYKLW